MVLEDGKGIVFDNLWLGENDYHISDFRIGDYWVFVINRDTKHIQFFEPCIVDDKYFYLTDTFIRDDFDFSTFLGDEAYILRIIKASDEVEAEVIKAVKREDWARASKIN